MSESGATPGAEASLDGRETCSRDLDLARRALADSGNARRELAGRLTCVARMLHALNSRWGSPLRAHDIEDLGQDVLVALWRGLPSYAGLSSLESWVFRACHRALAARLRRTPPVASARGGEMPEPVSRDGPEPDDDVYRALERLEPRARRVIELKHFEGMTFEEIGAGLERSPNTIKTWYYQALEELRRTLARGQRESEA